MRILLIAKNETDRINVDRILKKSTISFQIKEVANIDLGAAALEKKNFDCILVDDQILARKGLPFLHQVRISKTPIILLTTEEDSTFDLKENALNCLIRSQIDANLLKHIIVYAVEKYKSQITSKVPNVTFEQHTHVESVCSSESPLDLSKIETGKLTFELTFFNLRELIEEIIEQFSPTIEKDMALIVDYPLKTSSHFIGNPIHICQVLASLLDNAIKFTKQGYVLIKVEQETLENEKVKLKIAVRDSGIGICENIFEKFTKVDTSQTFFTTGLTTCKHLIELMGGNIGAKNLNMGSIFWFTIPLSLAKQEQEHNHSSFQGDLTNTRVLLATTHPMKSLMVEKFLSHCKIVNSFTSGHDALYVLKKAQAIDAPYQIMIFDHSLEDMESEDLITNIKSDPLLKNTLLLMLGSFSKKIDINHLKKIGLSEYLPNPLSQWQLLSTLKKICQPKQHIPSLEIKASEKEISRSNFDHIHALVVEDNDINLKIITWVLEKLGVQVHVATNGKEAIERVKKFFYNIIFMDCQMPQMNGYEATIQIRKYCKNKIHIPIIALTANALDARDQCIKAGMDDFISKPVSDKELQIILQKWCSTKMSKPEEVKKNAYNKIQHLKT